MANYPAIKPTQRKATHPIYPLLLHRWSPRAMSGEPMTDEEFMPLLEAARWAPSSYNSQPWRFIYAKRETPEWPILFNLLIDFNQAWCQHAAILVLTLSQKNFENGKPSVTHSFTAGAAWENLSLEGAARHYVVHGMQGFDYEKAYVACKIPSDYQVEVMTAIGKPGDPSSLPKEMQDKERPSTRKPLADLIFHGTFQSSSH